jgi:3-oxoadipate enol-lactonase
MPFARVNGIDLWYEDSGAGHAGAPTLILTHGFAGPYWPPVVEDLRRRFRFVRYHVRGHGRSSVPDDPGAYSVPQFAADLAGLMDALGIERAHVGGVSMGGMIAAQFACDQPGRLRSVLLCDTVCGNGDGEDEPRRAERWLRDVFAQQARVVRRHGLRGLVERENRYRREHDAHAHTRGLPDDALDAETARKLGCMTAEGYVHVAEALIARPDLVSRLPAVTAPALVSCGEWDAFYPCARRDGALLPDARFATVRRAAHATPDYQPHLWVRAVTDFIADVEAGRDVRGAREYAP